MDKIGTNLFENNNDDNELNAETMVVKQQKFDVYELIKIKNEQRNLKIETYKKHLSLCLQKIEDATKLGKTDMVYYLPQTDRDCPSYNIDECIEYIDEMLKNQKFDTLLMTTNTLFISWYYMELYMSNNNKIPPE